MKTLLDQNNYRGRNGSHILAFTTMLCVAVIGLGVSTPAYAATPVTCLSVHSQPNTDKAEVDGFTDSDCEKEFREAFERAQTGDGKALDDLARYYRFGVGTAMDLAEAQKWYERAVSTGRGYSLLSLARVHAALGNGDAAYENLQLAIEREVPNAERQLAFAHIDRKLGTFSNPDQGKQIIAQMALSGDLKASVPLILRYNWKRLPAPAPDGVLELVEREGLNGDPKAAEAALSYISTNSPVTASTISRRKALLDVSGLPARVKSSEELLLARDTKPATFWLEAERILMDAPKDAFERAALTTYRINRNAFYRVLQLRLAQLGYDPGPADGYLGRNTIKALNHFCRDHEIATICETGPRRYAVVKTVSGRLAETAR